MIIIFFNLIVFVEVHHIFWRHFCVCARARMFIYPAGMIAGNAIHGLYQESRREQQQQQLIERTFNADDNDITGYASSITHIFIQFVRRMILAWICGVSTIYHTYYLLDIACIEPKKKKTSRKSVCNLFCGRLTEWQIRARADFNF